MMQFLRKVFPYIIPVLLFTACEKDATIEVPESKPKLVVGCFLSPQDTTVRISVTRSLPLYSDPSQSLIVSDATVTLGNGSLNVVFPFTTFGGQVPDHYLLPVDSVFPILPGGTYYLTVSAPGLETVTASCTIPQLQPDTMLVQIDENDIYNIRCNVAWNDFSGQKNYYRVRVQSVLYDSINQVTQSVYNFQPEGAELVDDLNFDGASFNLTFLNDYLYHPEDVYDVYLMNIDENYFLYQRSLNDYNYSGDPFAEASPIHTNIKNGLGVFCGYQMFKKRFNP